MSSAPTDRQPAPALCGADVAGGILTRLRTVVEACPDGVAVTDAAGTMTFADLAARAGAVAEALGDDDPGRPVAMLCGHDRQAVATLLGGLLSGHPLLVLDPLTPVPRLRSFLDRLGVAVCLADAAHEALAAAAVQGLGRALRSPADSRGSERHLTELWRRPLDPGAVAALGFTSGSTGNPKVVALDHRHLVGDAWAGSSVDECVRVGDVMAHSLPMAFAAGTNATLTGVLSGATTALYDVRALGIAGLAAWIEQNGVSVLHASPAILRALVASEPEPRLLASLRSLTTAGEAAHGRDIAAARALLPSTCTVFHRFGSTETGLIAHLRLGPGEPTPDGPLPVGRPIGSTRIDLVDDDERPVTPGQPGTVRVTRSYLATGYWHDPDRTAEAFRDNPDGTRSYLSRDLGRLDRDGRLHLLGRRDHSVKIRGYLVEPGDVDAVLFAQPEVREVVTVGRPRAEDQVMQLVSYVVPGAGQVSPAALRAAVGRALPSYMVPQGIVLLDALPRTERGKVDRASLPEPGPAGAGSAGQALSAWERVVADVWARVLFVDDVGLDDDFFELGGDSLAAEALIAAMTGDLGVPGARVTTSVLAQAPTVRSFAARVTREPAGHDVLIPIQTGGTLPTLFVVAGGGGLGVAFLRLARHLGPDQPVMALQAHGMERRGVPDWSVRAVARRNIAAMRSMQPRGPYHLAGHSFGGLVAFEMAHQLHRAGQEVGQLIILDSFPPDPELQPVEPALPVPARLKQAIGLALTGIHGAAGSDQYWRFYRLSGVLARRYRSRPWAGDTVVVLAEGPEKDVRSRWAGHLHGSWRSVTVAGDHLSMIREPYVAETAEVVAAALGAWRDRHTPGRSPRPVNADP